MNDDVHLCPACGREGTIVVDSATGRAHCAACEPPLIPLPRGRHLWTEAHVRGLGVGAIVVGGLTTFTTLPSLRGDLSILLQNPWFLLFFAWCFVQLPAGVGLFLTQRWARIVMAPILVVGIGYDLFVASQTPLEMPMWFHFTIAGHLASNVAGLVLLLGKHGRTVFSAEYQRAILVDRSASLGLMLLSPFLWVSVGFVVVFKLLMMGALR